MKKTFPQENEINAIFYLDTQDKCAVIPKMSFIIDV